MNKINELLNNKTENHLMPFLWMHGEDESNLRHYIQKIAETGIKAVLIESRPHPEFVKEKWWEDVKIIIDECKKHHMKLWILDDSHFPTGYAAGEMENHPELQKQFLRIKQYDFIGPRKNAGIMLEWSKTSGRPNIVSSDEGNEVKDTDDNIIGVVAAKKTGYEQIDTNSLIDLTSNISGNTLYWDFPEGEWSIFVLVNTYDGGEESTKKYLNPIVKEATEILVDTVYEEHFSRFKEEFGNTILGFFSDEPRFGNVKGPDAIIGKLDMDIPWSNDLLTLLSKKLEMDESEVLLRLPLLQVGDDQKANKFRFNYMNLVSDLYAENFSEVLGNWCSSHNVEYIGHVIEDNNAHARLGYGAGHFFKSLSGQHMSGIDIVLHQLMPDYNNGKFKSMTSTGWDGEFFTYGLAKMGASLGYLDPKKSGRTMCEVFDAYGWNEGLSLMKYIADHMLASGVNYFVPHSFTMADYPDPDCPPHLYAHGHNPQYKYTNILVSYMNRISTLISDGKHLSDVAVLYHGESEWAGKSMFTQKPMRALIENQIEFDVVSNEYLLNSDIQNEKFIINNHVFKQLIIPYSERITTELWETLKSLIDNEVKITIVQNLPDEKVESSFDNNDIEYLKKINVVSLENLGKYIAEEPINKLDLSEDIPHLRYFNYQSGSNEVILLFNESKTKKVNTNILLNNSQKYMRYGAVTNNLYYIEQKDNKLELELDHGELIILISNVDSEKIIELKHYNHTKTLKNWSIDFEAFDSDEEYLSIKSKELPMLGVSDTYEKFVGTITYTTEIPKNITEGELYIEGANEVTDVSINGKSLGGRIGAPYKYELTPDLLADKENIVKIKVVNNLGRRNRDYLSQYILLEPLGISESVRVNYNKI